MQQKVVYFKNDKAYAKLCEHNHSNLLQLEHKMCKRHVNNLGNNLGCITGESTNTKSNLTFNHFIMWLNFQRLKRFSLLGLWSNGLHKLFQQVHVWSLEVCLMVKNELMFYSHAVQMFWNKLSMKKPALYNKLTSWTTKLTIVIHLIAAINNCDNQHQE